MKKVTRLLAFSFALLILTTCLTGCGSQSDVEVKWDLSMAVNGTDTQIDSLVANHFAELVAERSGGTIVINVFPNDTLAGGNATKGIEYVAVGGSDLGAYATSVLAGLEPKISVATIPWAFTSYEQARNVIDTSGGEYYAEMLAPKGITYLGSFHNGFRQLTNSKRPVTKPEDLNGLKLRVPGGDVYMEFFNALGANPTAMSGSEVFTAIQQGTIDGQENGCSITKSAKLACSHGGVTPANDGASHQSIEDMGVLRTIPNMTVIMPADYNSARKLVRAAAETYGPMYLRFTRDAIPQIYDENVEPTIGKAHMIQDGKDVAIIANGDTVCIALEAAKELEAKGISVRLLDMHTIKPLDVEAVTACVNDIGKIITVEDHNILNGLGSAVCEVVAEMGKGIVKRVGVQDQFGQSAPYERLLAINGITAENIVSIAEKLR